MKLYTKTGDKGETSLIYGRRVKKYDARVEAYGSIDEANAVIGVAAACLQQERTSGQGMPPDTGPLGLVEMCTHVQRHL
ncbi:MAG: ATP:cob(I)alamin adenosyltransferase, partial [Firmicutes bacterium]|nr:ATP:cob(I)alamin adenosyltransferase [Bacillota bacterium]